MKTIVMLMLATFTINASAVSFGTILKKCMNISSKGIYEGQLCNLERKAQDVARENYREDPNPENTAAYSDAVKKTFDCLNGAEVICLREFKDFITE